MNKKASIQLLPMPMQRYGISVSPMLADFSTLNDADLSETPHRHDFFSFFLLEDGMLEFDVDMQRITLVPASLVLLSPGIVHQCTQITNFTRIYALDEAAHSRLNTVYMTAYFMGAGIGTFFGLLSWSAGG